MQLRTLFACASFLAAAVAQISQDRIAFTVLPTAVQAGQPVTLQWGGGNGAPVTITLQKGTTTNLKTVDVLTGDATGNSYTWTPSSSLANGEDYALRIDQGTQPPNYTGMITLTGGSGSSSSSSSSSGASTTSGSGSSSVYAMSTASSSIPTSGSSSPSGGVIGGSQNSTSTSTPILNTNSTTAITAAPIGTGAVGTGASGSTATGTGLQRNTTLSRATLTSSSAAISSAEATSASGGSDTSSGPAPSSTSQSGAVVAAASNFALLCAAVVGVVYLG